MKNLDYGKIYEGKMIKRELLTIQKYAKNISKLLKDDSDLPEWVNKKVFIATDYINSVNNYLSSKIKHRTHKKKSAKKNKTQRKK